MNAVQAGEGLDRVDPAELLVDVHRVQQRLVEAGLELVGHHEEPVHRLLELRGRLAFADHLVLAHRVHPGLGVGLASVLDTARERDERLPRMTALLEVPIQRKLVAHGVQTRARHDHGLGPATDLVLVLRGEVLHDDADFLVNGVRVELDERPEQVGGFRLVVARVVLDLLEQPPVGLVGCVVLENVEDETLLDGLPHAVQMEGLELSVGPLGAEELERLLLRRGREGEGREIREPASALDLREDRVLELLLGRLGLGLLLLRLLEAPGG